MGQWHTPELSSCQLHKNCASSKTSRSDIASDFDHEAKLVRPHSVVTPTDGLSCGISTAAQKNENPSQKSPPTFRAGPAPAFAAPPSVVATPAAPFRPSHPSQPPPAGPMWQAAPFCCTALAAWASALHHRSGCALLRRSLWALLQLAPQTSMAVPADVERWTVDTHVEVSSVFA